MKNLSRHASILLALCFTPAVLAEVEPGFTALFDGRSLDGWKVSENKDSFVVEDGAIHAKGKRAHAFYVGDFNGAKFDNFELRLEAMTRKNSNGGIFFHTEYQEKGWPKGYEAQVNNTHSDWRKTGSLYNIADNKEPFKDDEWMKFVIRVENGTITITVNDKEIVNYKVPADASQLIPGGGAIALQAHDPGSKVFYRNIRIKPLE
jgi:hypothetical protein